MKDASSSFLDAIQLRDEPSPSMCLINRIEIGTLYFRNVRRLCAWQSRKVCGQMDGVEGHITEEDSGIINGACLVLIRQQGKKDIYVPRIRLRVSQNKLCASFYNKVQCKDRKNGILRQSRRIPRFYLDSTPNVFMIVISSWDKVH